jgi:diguanylate cyclase
MFDFSRRGWGRVVLWTIVGTIFCVAATFALDSYSFETGNWGWGTDPLKDLLIPLIIAPPLLFYLTRQQRELAIAHHELMTLAATDSLTQCLNRRAFTAIVSEHLARATAAEEQPSGALLLIDIDHFKRINDTYGHDRGDQALVDVAKAVREVIRDVDTVARVGGEEFAVFLPRLSRENTERISERIRARIGETIVGTVAQPARISASIGATMISRSASFSELYILADRSLYAAKRAGRNRVKFASELAGGELALN